MKRSLVFSALIVCVMVLSACTTPSSEETLPSGDTGAVMENQGTESNDSEIEVSEGQVYESTVTYDNPGGGDEVAFTLVVDDQGIVTDANAAVLAENSTSVTRQTAFKNGIKSAVVGKPLAGLTVDRVGGSSLTSGAFNEWVANLNQ